MLKITAYELYRKNIVKFSIYEEYRKVVNNDADFNKVVLPLKPM